MTCAANCALDGVDYASTFGVTTSGDSLRLKFVAAASTGTNVGSRVYLMQNATNYHMFNPLNMQFTVDVDVSALPCGLKGAVYFSEMASDGGKSKYPLNTAGAQYGTGYCDSHCPRDLKFIDGRVCVYFRSSLPTRVRRHNTEQYHDLPFLLGECGRLDPLSDRTKFWNGKHR